MAVLHGIDQIIEHYGWNGKFFLLTRDHTVEITTVGGGYDDVDIYEKGCLFHYANQWLYQKPNDMVDMFGRNFLDQVFIVLCLQLHLFVCFCEPKIIFKSLTTRKEGDRYLVRVQYDNEDLEMEVEEMFHHFTKLLKEQSDG